MDNTYAYSGEDLLSITEFSKISGMSVDALRYYRKIGVFLPACGNYYIPPQLITVKLVRILPEIGVPLRMILDLVRHRTPEKIAKLFSKYKHILADEISFRKDAYSSLCVILELQYEGMCATEDELAVLKLPEKRIALGGINDFGNSGSYFGAYTRFCTAPHEPKLNLSFPIGGYFSSMDSFVREPSRPERFFSRNPKGGQRREAGLYLTGYTRAPYGQTNDLPGRMQAYAKRNGLIFTGPVYNIFLFDEISVVDPSKYLLQVCAAVRKTVRIPSQHPYRRW